MKNRYIELKLLKNLAVGESAIVRGYTTTAPSQLTDSAVCQLIELGLSEGTKITVTHKAPLGGSPMALLVDNNMISVGARECELVMVDEESQQ